MESSGKNRAIKNREVRTVTLEFTDAYTDAGEPGLLVDAKFTPEPTDIDDLTVAQKWGKYIIEAILSSSKTSEIIDTDTEDVYSLKKKPDPNSQLN